jgi:hypothetical protein
MNPGTVLAAVLRGAGAVRHLDGPDAAQEVIKAHALLSDLMEQGHAAIEAAELAPDGSDTYCIPVDVLDAFSASLARAGGAA